MSGKVHTFVVILRRESPDLHWGLRLVGGSDIETPLIITRVNAGTPAQRELIRGDIITKIDDYDSRDLRHEDAQNLFRNAGNHIKLVIQRGVSSKHLYRGSYVGRCRTPTFREEFMSPDASTNRMPQSVSNGSSRCSSSMLYSPLPPPYIPVANSPYSVSPVSHGNYRPAGGPVAALPHTVFPPERPYSQAPPPYQTWAHCGSLGRKSPRLQTPMGYHEEAFDDGESIVNQPYRTTPLVLPGAKVKKEAGPTESYLRHHPNPSMRAAPHHDHDVLMRQRVADTMLQRVGGEEAAAKYAHKQFNSPIGLYSEANIADTIKRDTNTVPNGYLGRPVKSKSYKKTVLYDPAKSETYKALQEDSYGDHIQEVTIPVQTKVFAVPVPKTAPMKKPVPSSQQQQPPKSTYVSTLNDETIHQSNSFKRLMYHVLGETDY